MTTSEKKRGKISFDSIINSLKKSSNRKKQCLELGSSSVDDNSKGATDAAEAGQNSSELDITLNVKKLIQESETLVSSARDLDDKSLARDSAQQNSRGSFSIFKTSGRSKESCLEIFRKLGEKNVVLSSDLLNELLIDLGLEYNEAYETIIHFEQVHADAVLCGQLRKMLILLSLQILDKRIAEPEEVYLIFVTICQLFLNSFFHLYLPELQDCLRNLLDVMSDEQIKELALELSIKFGKILHLHPFLLANFYTGIPSTKKSCSIKLELIFCMEKMKMIKGTREPASDLLVELEKIIGLSHRTLDFDRIALMIKALWTLCFFGNCQKAFRERTLLQVKQLYSQIRDAGIQDMERLRVKDHMLRFMNALKIIN